MYKIRNLILDKLYNIRFKMTYYFKVKIQLRQWKEKATQGYFKSLLIKNPWIGYNIAIDLSGRYVRYTGRIESKMCGPYQWALSLEQVEEIYYMIAAYAIESLPEFREYPWGGCSYSGFHKILLTTSEGTEKEIHFNIDEWPFFEDRLRWFCWQIMQITGADIYNNGAKHLSLYWISHRDRKYAFVVSATTEEVAKEVVYYHYLNDSSISMSELEVKKIQEMPEKDTWTHREYNMHTTDIIELYKKKAPRIDLRKNPETQRWEVLTLERYYEAFGFYDAQLKMVILILGLEHPRPGHAKPPYCP